MRLGSDRIYVPILCPVPLYLILPNSDPIVGLWAPVEAMGPGTKGPPVNYVYIIIIDDYFTTVEHSSALIKLPLCWLNLTQDWAKIICFLVPKQVTI